MNTVCLINERAGESVTSDRIAGEVGAESGSRQAEIRWTTKQVLAACLWSAFFGLGCGYAWFFLQVVMERY